MHSNHQTKAAKDVGPRVNAHIHLPPNFSAFDRVEQAVDLAEAQDVRVLGVSNYYDYRVYAEFGERARSHGIYPLYGIEIIALLQDLQRDGVKLNDPGNPGKMYLCGKGLTAFDPMSDEARRLLEVIRRKDSERMAEMTRRLAEVFRAAGLEADLDEETVKMSVVRRHGSPYESVYLQERHVAQAFQEALFEEVAVHDRDAVLKRAFDLPAKSRPDDAVGVQNEIRSNLMKAGRAAYVDETFVGFEHAYRLVLAMGGIPCYPVLADGAGGPLCEYEDPVYTLIARLKERQIHAAEFIPIRNRPEVLSHYVKALRDAGFIVTAGTEHNTRDLIPLNPTCLDGAPIPDDIQTIFFEGACVVAAHQHLRAEGSSGFVDESGRPNTGYSDTESRIRSFAATGAEVIERSLGKRS